MLSIQKLSNLNIKSLFKYFILISALFIFTFLIFLLVDKNQTINSTIYDSYLKLRLYVNGKQYIDYKIVHIDIDETIYRKSGIYSERLIYSKILDNLKKIKPAYTLVDTVFTDLKKSGDDLTLAESIKNLDNLYFPVIFIPEILDYKINQDFDTYVEFDERKYLNTPKINNKGYPYNFGQIIPNYPAFQKNIKNIGHNHIIPDKDGVIRKVPLYIKYKELYAPILSFKLILDYFGVSDDKIEINFGKNIVLKDARFSDGAVKNIKIPIDNKGNTLLDFPSESKYSFIRYSAHYFLDDKNIDKLGSELKGNIVILSENDAFNSKYYSTPYDNFFQLSGVHSVLINSILNEKFIYNPSYFIYFLVYIIIIISYSVFARYCNINKLIISSIIMIFAIIIFSLSLFVLFNIYFDIFIIVVTIEISTALLTLYKYSNVKFNNLLLYIATHDIKNDVYSVVMNSKIIKSIKELDGTTRTKLIEEITNSSGRVYDFIERITLLLKLGRGKFASNMRSTNLFEIISQIRSKYENITTDKKLKIEVFGDKNISVLGDKDIILEIFDNLISNAVKYSQNGGVIEITINTEKKYASVSIKDGGQGLDNYEKKKLFKEFYITKNNNDSGVKRVGLGLYITKNLVRLSKGRISVNSEKGKGSVFIVYLPKEIMRSIKILQKKAPEYDRIY